MAFDNTSIYQDLAKAWGMEAANELGRAFITNLFAQNQSLPNNFDVQLGRLTFEDSTGTNTLVISGHAPGFENVTGAPKLPRQMPDHWTVYLEGMHVNGKPIAFNNSIVSGVPSGTLLAVLDSGFSFPPLPTALVDAIYSQIPGAVVYNSSIGAFDGWIVPCNFTPIDVSFTFGYVVSIPRSDSIFTP